MGFITRPMGVLPNEEGYEFIGIDSGGDEHVCVVVKHTNGMHCVERKSDGKPFFFVLSKWRELPAPPAPKEG